MARIITIFGTSEGQTAKVAERIDTQLSDHGHKTTTVNVKEIGPNLDISDSDAILVGASIHMGKHQKAVRRFVSANRDVLVTKPTGFFQVSGSSRAGTEKGAAEAAQYVDEFIKATGWRPDRIGLFGGALRFSEYGFLMRALVKFVALLEAVPNAPEPVLLHDDYRFGNLLVDPKTGAVQTVLDWGTISRVTVSTTSRSPNTTSVVACRLTLSGDVSSTRRFWRATREPTT